MTSLHVTCSLGPLPIKNPGYAYTFQHIMKSGVVTLSLQFLRHINHAI